MRTVRTRGSKGMPHLPLYIPVLGCKTGVTLAVHASCWSWNGKDPAKHAIIGNQDEKVSNAGRKAVELAPCDQLTLQLGGVTVERSHRFVLQGGSHSLEPDDEEEAAIPPLLSPFSKAATVVCRSSSRKERPEHVSLGEQRMTKP